MTAPIFHVCECMECRSDPKAPQCKYTIALDFACHVMFKAGLRRELEQIREIIGVKRKTPLCPDRCRCCVDPNW